MRDKQGILYSLGWYLSVKSGLLEINFENIVSRWTFKKNNAFFALREMENERGAQIMHNLQVSLYNKKTSFWPKTTATANEKD